jgi:hypothetical protein
MKALKILMISVVLLTANMTLLAQPASINPMTDTVRWEYNTILNLTNNEVISLQGHLISYGSQSFVWSQNGVENPYTLTAISIEGNWEDANTAGTITSSVTWEGFSGLSGTIRLFRDSAPAVRIDVGEPGGLTPHIILQIHSMTKL